MLLGHAARGRATDIDAYIASEMQAQHIPALSRDRVDVQADHGQRHHAAGAARSDDKITDEDESHWLTLYFTAAGKIGAVAGY